MTDARTERPDDTPTAIGGFFGRRVGRGLREGQRSLMGSRLPAYAVPLDETRPHTLRRSDLFPADVTRVALEIGFGSGEHMLGQLASQRDLGMIGCEPFINGMASLLRHAESADIGDRLRLHDDDAGPVMRQLADASLDCIFLLFPDPWPKRRHARRRFLQPDSLDEMARLLVDDGILRLASDHPVMVDWMLLHTRPHPDFEWLARSVSDWREPPPDWQSTRYEAKRLHGEPCYFTFRRRARRQANK